MPDSTLTEPESWSGGEGFGDGWSGDDVGGWPGGGSPEDDGGGGGGSDGGEAPSAAELSAPTGVDLGAAAGGVIAVANAGGQPLVWEAATSAAWLSLEPDAGPQPTVGPGAVVELGIVVDHAALTPGGAYAAEVHLSGNGGEQTVAVTGTVPHQLVPLAEARVGQVCVTVVPLAHHHPQLVTLLVKAHVHHTTSAKLAVPGHPAKAMAVSGSTATASVTGAQAQLLASSATVHASGAAFGSDSAVVPLTPGCHPAGPVMALAA